MKNKIALLLLAVALTFSGCGYNSIQSWDEAVSSAHSQMLSVYQKRADLIPNLVNVVKGYAVHEKAVLTEVTAARAKVGQVILSPDAKPEQVAAFLKDQNTLSSALTRLLVVAENYPQLKADRNFLDLQQQLEVMESQATAARNKYIRSIETYNTTVRKFPVNITAAIFGYEKKLQMQFEDEREILKSPKVEF